MSFKDEAAEITNAFTLFPRDFALRNYASSDQNPSWYMGCVSFDLLW
ncbi:hypothetical protein PE067_00895 [Paracoccus sp. DMF-8]|nr:hypothetical protein [Paracoccus sp. DMF-8]MDF3604842.1 hypothetical protein [Paracoccus sp. DMF-8]